MVSRLLLRWWKYRCSKILFSLTKPVASCAEDLAKKNLLRTVVLEKKKQTPHVTSVIRILIKRSSALDNCKCEVPGVFALVVIILFIFVGPLKKKTKTKKLKTVSIWLQGVLHLVAREVGMDILLKQHSKLLSNTFDINYRSSLKLVKNLRFRLLYLVAGELNLVAMKFCIWLLWHLAWTFF